MRLYCRYRYEELPFTVNLQKSQFLGVTESRDGDILYLIAEDISVEINNISINEQMVNGALHCLILKN